MYRIHWPEVIEQARDIVTRYEYGVTLRQLYYILFSRGIIPHSAPTYRRLSARLAEARRRGDFPPLIDTVRQVHVPPSYTSPTELLTAAVATYRRDHTEGQPTQVWVGAEKDTVRAAIAQWTHDHGIPVIICRGYGSQSYVDDVRGRVEHDGRPAVLAYVGDWDASGLDIQRDWTTRTHCWDTVERLAVTHDQAAHLPAATAKPGDPRWPKFATRYGYNPTHPIQWEVEALDPDQLRQLVLDAIHRHTNPQQLDRVLDRERTERTELAAFVQQWREYVRPARHRHR
ncbi:hypothetical protein GCM10012275_61510 [Longimycelium tulufanense]|uniref:DUF2399 domain-containing protein n=1 Tax=Longimycelium tulufanense TaxID=907463 RepID=A0A8J3CIT8_9PSEU|nr:hypothetical protein [Longimycelium tulufanense]GGM82633.1 hypothetical protein GCM10012275_61510 [Longimycelium tulufanense]